MPRGGHLLVGLSGAAGDASLLRYAALVAQFNCRARCPLPALGTSRTRLNGKVLSPSLLSSSALPCAEDIPLAETAQVDSDPGYEVRFVHVLPRWGDTETAPNHRRALQQLRRTVRAHFPAADRGPILCDVLKGPPTKRLLDFAREQECDLILAGQPATPARRRSLVRRLVLEAPCSVWLVPEAAPPAIRTILVPTDFSQPSADALHVALALARRTGAKCLPLHVYFNDAVVSYPEYDQVLRQEKQQAYQTFVADLDASGVSVEPLLVEGAKISHVITRVARKHAVDLIVMTTRGRSRAAAFMLGSVTEPILLQTRVPLLVVKQPGTTLGFFQALVDKTFRRQDSLRFN